MLVSTTLVSHLFQNRELAIGKRPPRKIEGVTTFKDLTEFDYFHDFLGLLLYFFLVLSASQHAKSMFSVLGLIRKGEQNEGICGLPRDHFRDILMFWVLPNKHNPVFQFWKTAVWKSADALILLTLPTLRNQKISVFSWNSVRSLGDISGFIIFWNSAFLELCRPILRRLVRFRTFVWFS